MSCIVLGERTSAPIRPEGALFGVVQIRYWGQGVFEPIEWCVGHNFRVRFQFASQFAWDSWVGLGSNFDRCRERGGAVASAWAGDSMGREFARLLVEGAHAQDKA